MCCCCCCDCASRNDAEDALGRSVVSMRLVCETWKPSFLNDYQRDGMLLCFRMRVRAAVLAKLEPPKPKKKKPPIYCPNSVVKCAIYFPESCRGVVVGPVGPEPRSSTIEQPTCTKGTGRTGSERSFVICILMKVEPSFSATSGDKMENNRAEWNYHTQELAKDK